jgi:hypothetical protein
MKFQSGILGSGFVEEIARKRRRHCPHCEREIE